MRSQAILEARRLRERYLDPQHNLICRGLVRLAFRDRDERQGTPLNTPRIEGWFESLRPGEVFVRLPHNRLLEGLRRIESGGRDNSPPKEPSFVVRIGWGANYEPWVEGVRLLNMADAEVKKPERGRWGKVG